MAAHGDKHWYPVFMVVTGALVVIISSGSVSIAGDGSAALTKASDAGAITPASSAGGNAEPPAVSPPAGAGGDSPKMLKGGVRGAVLITEDGLIKMDETVRDLQKSSLLLMGEVTRKETVVVKGPNVLPGGVVIPAVPQPSGTVEMGHLPARRGLVNGFLNQLTYYVRLLQNEIDALIIPDSKAALVAEPWGQIRADMSKVQEHYTRLQGLAEAPKLDEEKIGAEALAIYDAMGRIHKLRRQVFKLIKSG